MEEEYKQAEAAFHRTFKKWRETVLADLEIKKYVRVNPIRKWFIRLGVPLWIAYSLLSAWMGKADPVDLLLIVLLLLAGSAVYFLKRHKRLALPIYLLAGSLATGVFTFEISDMYAVFSVLCILIAFFSIILLIQGYYPPLFSLFSIASSNLGRYNPFIFPFFAYFF